MDNRPTVIWQLNREQSGVGLSTYEAYRTIDEIAALEPARLVIDGSDRGDLDQLIEYSRRRRLEPGLVTGPLGPEEIDRLRRAGLSRLIFTVNESRIPPAVENSIRYARERRIAVEVNTTVTKENMKELAGIVEVIEPFDLAAWNVDFGLRPNFSPADADQIFAFIAAAASARKFRVRAIEAPQYGRYLLQGWSDFAGFVPTTVDGKNPTVVVTTSGDVRANASLPLCAGNVRYRPLKAIYRNGDLFVALRDRRNLKGKCGQCEYNKICGGSRGRAWAVTGDLFAPDPLCSYQPA